MAEPGAVSGAVAQSNPQGLYSSNHYNSLTIQSQGNDVLPQSVTQNGVGFSNNGAVESTQGTGETGENDEVRGDEFATSQEKMGAERFSMDNLPESPYYAYNTKPLSDGNEPFEQTYHGSRRLGRGMNLDDIRNGFYYSTAEAEIFRWDMPNPYPNITKPEISFDNDFTVRDV